MIYHGGARLDFSDNGVEEMPITLTPNPSHLEFVDPVVEGRARAAQDNRTRPGKPVQDPTASLAIMIHGDAAFPGQGVVAETLNMSQLPGYSVGGTIHMYHEQSNRLYDACQRLALDAVCQRLGERL